MKFEVSVIIVNWKVCELLRHCLQSLRTSAGLALDQLQIIVVDNNSQDGSVEMVAREFPEVVMLANQDNPGFGRANNQALGLCQGRYILLLNPDTVVLDHAIRIMVECMDQHRDIAVLGSRLLNADRSLQRWTGGAFPRAWNLINHYLFLDQVLPRALRSAPLYLDHDVQTDIDVDWVSGACMMLRVDRLQGRLFDPAFFMYGEDMELCHRLKTAGGRVVYTPRASIIHYQGASMKQQRGDVLLSSLKGPRQFYRQMRGEGGLWWFDTCTITGFALRWLLYAMAARLRSSSALAEKSASSKDMMLRAWRIRQG